jgi:hypothetical protein
MGPWAPNTEALDAAEFQQAPNMPHLPELQVDDRYRLEQTLQLQRLQIVQNLYPSFPTRDPCAPRQVSLDTGHLDGPFHEDNRVFTE